METRCDPPKLLSKKVYTSSRWNEEYVPPFGVRKLLKKQLSTKYPQGGRLYLKYNASDRPNELWKTMTAPALDELQASVVYDQRGLMTSMSRPDGWQQGWSYSEGGLMTVHSVNAARNNQTSVTYTYETAAPVTGKLQTMTQNGNTVTYGYDVLGRLSSATSAAWNQSYTYDGFSNLSQKTGSTGTQNWSCFKL